MAAVPTFHLPDVHVTKRDRPKFRIPEAIANIDLPTINMSDVDLAEALHSGAVATGLRRPARRSRWPFAIGGLMVVGAVAWGLMNNPRLRLRLRDLRSSIRESISSMRPNAFDLATDRAETIAFPAAETKPISSNAWDHRDTIDTPDYPDGLGSRKVDPIPAIKAR